MTRSTFNKLVGRGVTAVAALAFGVGLAGASATGSDSANEAVRNVEPGNAYEPVDSFLLMISSALVRDIYQRNINPEVTERTVRRLSYFFTFVVGIAATLGALNPPEYLQDIIVYTGSGLAACFLAPMALSLYWPRINVQGAMAGMVGGFLAHLSLYVAGFIVNNRFAPYALFDIDPIIWGLAASAIAGVGVSLITTPPPKELVARFFDAPSTAPEPA